MCVTAARIPLYIDKNSVHLFYATLLNFVNMTNNKETCSNYVRHLQYSLCASASHIATGSIQGPFSISMFILYYLPPSLHYLF